MTLSRTCGGHESVRPVPQTRKTKDSVGRVRHLWPQVGVESPVSFTLQVAEGKDGS